MDRQRRGLRIKYAYGLARNLGIASTVRMQFDKRKFVKPEDGPDNCFIILAEEATSDPRLQPRRWLWDYLMRSL